MVWGEKSVVSGDDLLLILRCSSVARNGGAVLRARRRAGRLSQIVESRRGATRSRAGDRYAGALRGSQGQRNWSGCCDRVHGLPNRRWCWARSMTTRRRGSRAAYRAGTGVRAAVEETGCRAATRAFGGRKHGLRWSGRCSSPCCTAVRGGSIVRRMLAGGLCGRRHDGLTASLYRAMAWLGEELPARSRTAARHCAALPEGCGRGAIVRSRAICSRLDWCSWTHSRTSRARRADAWAARLQQGSPAGPSADDPGGGDRRRWAAVCWKCGRATPPTSRHSSR